MIRVLFALVLVGAAARPVQQDYEEYVTESTEPLEKYMDLAVFVVNFKRVTLTYIRALYSHLTGSELKTVLDLLQAFLDRFVVDLIEILYNEDYRRLREPEVVDDGELKELFVDIRPQLKAAFEQLDDEKTDEVVFRLKGNLLNTKQKIEQLIDDAMKTQVGNSSLTVTS